jgi:hypothetical protein
MVAVEKSGGGSEIQHQGLIIERIRKRDILKRIFYVFSLYIWVFLNSPYYDLNTESILCI